MPHCDGCIVECRQCISLDIADLGGVVFQAVYDIADMFTVQFQEPAFDDLGWCFLPADTDIFPCGTADLQHQFHIALQHVLVVGIALPKNVIFDIF